MTRVSARAIVMRAMAHLCLLFGAIAVYGQSGSICGTVLDENGAPARLVKVVAMTMGPHSGALTGRTDKSGHYCVSNLPAGDYMMSAHDPEKGYPEMSSIFYSAWSADLEPKASITAQNSKSHVDWQIPYKAGFVKVHLTDAVTGKQIIPMSFNLVVQSRPDAGFMRGAYPSTELLLVPPHEDIDFTVSSPGYKEWPGDGIKMVFRLAPGNTKELEIALEPAESPAP